MKTNNRNVLFLSPHPDDHLMCAGTLFKLKKAGFTLFEVLFTDGSKAGDHALSKLRLQSHQKACDLLGVQQVYQLNYPNQRYAGLKNWKHRFNMSDLVEIIKNIRPQILILPPPKDYHPEHESVSRLGLEAVKVANIYSDFGGPWRVPLVLFVQGLLPLPNLKILIDTSDFFDQVKKLTLIYEKEITGRLKQWLTGSSANFGYYLRAKRAEGFAIPKEWPGDISVLLD